MINDVYTQFKNLYIETNGKILTENFLLEKEPSICVKVDDKGRVLDKLIVVDESVKKDELYDWFSIRNIKSKYLESNKAVGNKMIFSSNNYSLFGRIDTFPFITSEGFKKLFDVKPDNNNKKTMRKLIFFKKYNENRQIEKVFKNSNIFLLNDLIEKFDLLTEDENQLLEKDSFITDDALNTYFKKLQDSYECKEEQFFTYEIVIFILKQLENEIKKYAHKQIKLKIFRNKDIDKYEKSELKYLNSSLFAVEDSNKLIDNNFSQPYLDSTLNADKPFMIHNTTKFKISFPKSKDEILYIKYLDDYLSMKKGLFYLNLENFSTNNKPYSKNQFIILKKKNYEIFEFLPNYKNDFFEKPFSIKNFLQIKKNRKIENDKKAFVDTWELEKEIDKYLNKKLIKNYFSENIKGIDKKLETYLFLIRDICFLYFKKGQATGKELYAHIHSIMTDVIIYHYFHTDEKLIRKKTSELLNLKLSMKEYYKGEQVNIKEELKSLEKKVISKNYEELSQQEFLLLSGQMAYYLTYQSESSNKTFRLVEHYLKSKNSKTIKTHLRHDFEKYKHKLYLVGENLKFKNAIAILLAYDKELKFSNEDLDALLIGLVSENILF